MIGCYSGWMDDGVALYADCGSDIGFSFHLHEGWKYIGNGGMSAGVSEVWDFYNLIQSVTATTSSPILKK